MGILGNSLVDIFELVLVLDTDLFMIEVGNIILWICTVFIITNKRKDLDFSMCHLSRSLSPSWCDFICCSFSLTLSWIISTRTNFVASSKHFEKIIASRSKQLSALFIGLNESSHQERFNQSIFFEKFQILQKLSWKN